MPTLRRRLPAILATVIVLCLVALLTGTWRIVVGAQAGNNSLTGILSVVWLDSDDGSVASTSTVLLTSAIGDTTVLAFDAALANQIGNLETLSGATVTVWGGRGVTGASTVSSELRVTALSVERSSESASRSHRDDRRTVRSVYLVPSDRHFRLDYLEALQDAGVSLRGWYRTQMGNGKTFTLRDGVVEVYHLSHPAAWYQRSRSGGASDFYVNVIEDGFAAVGGRTSDHAWMFSIDAAPACGQSARSGGGGIVVIGVNALHGLAGEPSIPTCSNESLDSASHAEWLGSLAHQMGHAFGLPHPPACESTVGTCDESVLMWRGFHGFPAATFGPDERATLDRSPFLSPTTPFGSFDTPADGAVVSGEVAVTGWALDDKAVTTLELYRAPVAGETPGANGLVFVGNAIFVNGARPDIATAYPAFPNNTTAGWGYMLLTNTLPNQGDGPFTLSAFAKDADGQNTLLGTKTITVANSTAKKPFGTIDTPPQGATISGTYTNFGWALTPQPNTIPTDGSTIDVDVDNAIVGRPVYNQFRADIANLFPGLNNSKGAVGYFTLDTRLLADGLHSISWNVRDNAGNVQGIGSRYFTTKNAGSCVVSISPTSQFVTEAATVGSLTVTAAPSCQWAATSNASFITVTSGATGAGSGTVSYSVSAMTTGSSRTGTLTIGGQTFTLTQQVCSYTVSPTLLAAEGGTAKITVTAPSGCIWSVQSDANFIAVTSGPSGSGTSPVTINVQPNSGVVRGGTLTIGELFKMVNAKIVQQGQAGAESCVTAITTPKTCLSCSPSSSWVFDPNGGTRAIDVSAASTCAWIATPTVSWIDVNAESPPPNPPFGLGSSRFGISVPANSMTVSRSGGVTAGGMTFAVTQQACTEYSVSPTSVTVLAGGGTAVFSVTTNCVAPWTAASNATFMTITSGNSGTGNGSVSVAVAANSGPTRTGTLTIAGRTVTVTQLAP